MKLKNRLERLESKTCPVDTYIPPKLEDGLLRMIHGDPPEEEMKRIREEYDKWFEKDLERARLYPGKTGMKSDEKLSDCLLEMIYSHYPEDERKRLIQEYRKKENDEC